MSGIGKSSSALAGNGECTLKRQSAGPILVAFPPKRAQANRPSARPLGTADRAHSARAGAQVIPFRPRRFAAAAQTATWAPAGEHANIGDGRLSAPGYNDRRLEIIEGLLGLGWVVASMTAGYYMLTALSTVAWN
jgi:hypothetical protein